MKNTFFNTRRYAIMQLFYRAHGFLDIKDVRQFADGRIEIDASGYCVPMRTFNGCIASLPNGKARIRIVLTLTLTHNTLTHWRAYTHHKRALKWRRIQAASVILSAAKTSARVIHYGLKY